MSNANKIVLEIQGIKMRLQKGIITYNEAKEEIKPLIEQMNNISKEIAIKFGKTPHKFNISSLLR